MGVLRKLRLPIAVGVIVAAGTLLLWRALEREVRYTIQRTTEAEASLVATRIRGQAESRFQALRRMAARWGEWGAVEERWEFDAALAYDARSFVAIEWVDPTARVRWAVPKEHEARIRDIDISSEPRKAAALRSARDRRLLQVTPPIQLIDGSRGFRVFAPILNEKFEGYIAGVFNSQELFDAVLEGIAPGYGVAISAGDEELYRRSGSDGALEAVWNNAVKIPLQGTEWTVRVWPGAQTLERSRSALPAVVLAGGLLMAFLLPLTVYWGQTARERATQLEAAYKQLAEQFQQQERMAGQLRQSQKLEALGRLTGGIAHDFNNLLGVMIGYAEILAEQLPANAPTQKSVTAIANAGRRAADLTRQLLAFSRMQVMEPRVLDLNTVVAETDQLLRRLIGEDIRLAANLAAGLGRVKADPSQVHQVVMNLAVNARDAMPDGGKLTLETMNVELDETYARTHANVPPGQYVMISVSDTGVGMDKETQARIFEPFFTTKAKGRGTGLGLATVYGIVKQSGGYIWVYSEPGKGTTFKVYLPRVEEPLPPVERVAEAPLPRGTETVLLAEDERALRELVGEVLRDAGYKVLEADGAARAEQLAREHSGPIHLLLTDVVLTDRSGSALADSLTAVRPELKVLFVSGYTSNAIVHHGVLEPGKAFLQKPFTRAALLRKIRALLSGTHPS